MHSGESAGQVAASSIDRRVSRSTPSGQSRSVHASPTPPQDRATRRKETSQYPAIGARRRLVARGTWPMRRGVMAGGLYRRRADLARAATIQGAVVSVGLDAALNRSGSSL